tara:strand:- start:96 stop:341 length:246 start_codon:yes stop_codon:yes gene_type:complete
MEEGQKYYEFATSGFYQRQKYLGYKRQFPLKQLCGWKIEGLYKDWDYWGEHKYLLGGVDPFYKYALNEVPDIDKGGLKFSQ